MLTCVYHPIDMMQVVEDDVAERMLATGVWFDSPLKASNYRLKVEDEIKLESKPAKPKTKQKGKSDER